MRTIGITNGNTTLNYITVLVKMYLQSIKKENVSADTDSLFVSFAPAIEHCTWKNLVFNEKYINSIESKFIILSKNAPKFNNCVGIIAKYRRFH
jgi:hypothetical protein